MRMVRREVRGLHAATLWVHLDWVLLVVAAWLLIAVVGVFALRRLTLVARVLFPVGGAGGLALLGIALSALQGSPEVAVLPIGLPQLPFHFRLDSLSAFFLMVIGAHFGRRVGVCRRLLPQGRRHAARACCAFEYHLFLASMVLVVLADDAYAFMVMWETMALSSFFLVTANHRIVEIQRRLPLPADRAYRRHRHPAVLRRAAGGNTGDYTFANMRAQQLSPFWASLAFLLALFGFRRQGRHPAAARLAARGASGRALAGVGADERGDAEDRHLRCAARLFDLLQTADLVVGPAAAGGRPGHGAVRRALSRRCRST
jgi:hydrogenase-4 component B